MAEIPATSPPQFDRRSGYSASTRTFFSLRAAVHLPPENLPLSYTSYAFSFIPSPPPPIPAYLSSSDDGGGAPVYYSNLISRVQNLARSLTSQARISKGDVAFILVPPCLEIPILYLALLSIGVVVSPANPSSTAAEISRLISLTNPAIAFAVSSTFDKLPVDLKTILIDSPTFASFVDSPLPITAEITQTISQSDPAAIFYTSGTTGLVKGAVLTHGNLIASVASLRVAGEKRRSAAVLMVTAPPFHIYGFVFSLKGVINAETTVMLTERFDAVRAIAAIKKFGVMYIAVAPPALASIVGAVDNGRRKACQMRSLEAVSCGGAPLPVELIGRFAAIFPGVWLAQGYGLTESTSGVFRHINSEEGRRFGSSGRLVANCEAKIVDPIRGNPLPPCSKGELWLRGPTIMKGYIGDPEATSATLDHEGWLRTGDLCYIDEDGFLFIVDRLKELIKYKGYQVSPTELEGLLQTHSDIVDAAVVPYPDSQAGQVPMAFVVRKPHSTLSENQIMDFVAGQVAPYKKIRRVALTNSIPRNPAGKILRKDLMRLVALQDKSKL